ncbi:MAG: methyltransferase domain-containing protein [Proteobacteria bacterium]|nr:methyltransferase domain-containing protein [Pseudomonadota bacterium]
MHSAPSKHLPSKLRATPPTQQLEIEACGRTWLVERPGDLESYWDQLELAAFQEDERLPYWVEIWPASLLVCRWLAENRERIAGKLCLDLGCGLGFTAMVASFFGARVIGLDYERDALAFARRNVALNDLPSPLFTVMDWREPGLRPGAFPFIWAGDVLYETRFFEPVEALLRTVLATDGEVLIGDPERTVSRPVWERLRGLGWKAEQIMLEKLVLLGQNQTVRLWRLMR